MEETFEVCIHLVHIMPRCALKTSTNTQHAQWTGFPLGRAGTALYVLGGPVF